MSIQTLQQTAAAILVPREITAHSAAAAAKLIVRTLGSWQLLGPYGNRRFCGASAAPKPG